MEEKTKHYDAIIIGSGQAGTPLAKKLAQAGKKTALIEKRFVGGNCINDGCTPTKALIASAHAAYHSSQAGNLGIEIDSIKVDLKKIIERKDEIVSRFRSSAQKGLEETEGLELIFGEASFSGFKEITVTRSTSEKQVFTADWIFIDTGAKTAIPPIKGLEDVAYLTSTTILDQKEIPEHLVIIGGNYIGLEFGQMFHRFGSKVTVLEQETQILGGEDEDVADEVSTILRDEGLDVFVNASTHTICYKDGKILLKVTIGTEQKEILGSHLLIATGRKPQTELLKLNATGVLLDDKGYIVVNDKLETNIDGIYALGDVKGGPAFTHISYNDYTIVYRNLIENSHYTIADRIVPYCMFTDPQLGRVGLSEAQAKAQGIDYLVAKISMSKIGRAIETNETFGFMKAIVDRKNKKILGASILSAQGGELMTILQMAMAGGITYDQLNYFIFAHPTYAEALNNLFMTIEE